MRSGKTSKERNECRKGKYRMGKIMLPFFLMLTVLCDCAPAEVVRDEVIETVRGDVTAIVQTGQVKAGTLDSRIYSYSDGGVFSTMRLTAASKRTQKIELCELHGEQGMLRWYNAKDKAWKEQPLKEGIVTMERPIIETDAQSAVITLPQMYTPHENMIVEYMPEYKSSLHIKQVSDGWRLTVEIPPIEKGMRAEWNMVAGEGAIIDWSSPYAQETWENYSMTAQNRWCYDGYYYIAPSSYIPSGDNYYHLLIASYLVQSYTSNEVHPAAYYYAVGMLDTMLEQQNEYGFFPTHAGSEWLRDDYGIGAGFYDTRFNSDLVETLLDAYVRYGVEKFAQPVRDYLDFFMQHAEAHHTAFGDGWMINDYSHPAGGINTVSSLNHQLAELLVLYQAGEAFQTDEYDALAARMLRGIENSEQIWHKADGNLEYGVLSDGVTMHGAD